MKGYWDLAKWLVIGLGKESKWWAMVILFQKQGISKTGGSITEGQRIKFRKAATDPICKVWTWKYVSDYVL